MSSRAAALFQQHLDHHHGRVHRIFSALMLVQWLFVVLLSAFLTPLTWIGEHARVSQHVIIAVLFGGLLTGGAITAIRTRPTATATRHLVAACQVLYSTLIIHLSGGRPESHFHVFGSIAFLSFYRDWRILITATALVSLDHYARGAYWPISVFGTPSPSPWRWIEHSAWVLFGDIVLIANCIISTREMRQTAAVHAHLEGESARTEAEVHLRIVELQQTTNALRESENLLRHARDAAEAANRAKSEFLANMSHEIRTPMTAILGYADLLSDPEQSPQGHANCASVIRRNGEQLLGLINDILDLSKIEAGRLDLEKIECSLPALVDDVCALMKVRATAKGLPLSVTFDRSIPPVRTDPARLRQALINVLGNAIKFTEHGQVSVSVSGTIRGNCVVVNLDIADTGIGISSEALARLCLPFQQADASITRRYGGSGLGLMLTNRLVSALGGKLSIESELGRGTTVRINLVLPLAESREIKAYPEAPPIQHSTEFRGRILLAEDGPDNQRLISFYLKKAGASVTIAENGQIAVEQAIKSASMGQPFDVILMDMQMPELDGYGATAKLRELGWTGPIIALTAHAMAGDRERCLAMGCDEYLTKPIDRAHLVQTCARFARDPFPTAGTHSVSR
jgi:signal transduction histidine kinase/ActR/RegA family two-component response regulator